MFLLIKFNLLNILILGPTHLSLTQSLETIKLFYDELFTNRNNTKRKPFGHASIILMRDPLSDSERKSALNILNNIKTTYPELNIIFITSDRDDFTVLTNFNDVSLITNMDDDEKTANEIRERLLTIPKHLLSYASEEFNDYITPNMTNTYEINRKYIKYGNINVKFSNHEYGTFIICVFEKRKNYKRSCKTVELNGDVEYNPRDYCLDGNDCTIIFEVTSNSSLVKCSGKELQQFRIAAYSPDTLS